MGRHFATTPREKYHRQVTVLDIIQELARQKDKTNIQTWLSRWLWRAALFFYSFHNHDVVDDDDDNWDNEGIGKELLIGDQPTFITFVCLTLMSEVTFVSLEGLGL